jgi:hypothetical protein
MKKVIVLLGIFISTIIGHATPTVQTNKMVYNTNESITVNVTDMFGDPKDWIAIYPSGTSNEWENVLRWSWTDGFTEGSKTFESLPIGDYDARVFFENSYNLEVSSSFSVEEMSEELNISTSKSTYLSSQPIIVNFENMLGDQHDWIAIYPKGSTNEWQNVLRWSWTDGVKTGSFSFDALAQGEYEARAFFENSFNLEKSSSFTVSDVQVDKDAFIATWEIGASKSLQLSTFNDGGSTPFAFDFNVDWGDGTNSQNVTSTIKHHYESEGNFTVKVTGIYPIPQGLCFEDSDQSGNPVGYQKLVSIDQWGTQKWKSMRRVFWNCKDFNIINDPKAPDLSETKDMNIMFWGATKFNQPIGHWDVSRVMNMERMFFDASSFNQDVSTWDISKINHLHFNGSALSTENYDKLLIAWSQLNVQPNVSFGTAPTHYTNQAITARQRLIDEFNWGIFDAGLIN